MEFRIRSVNICLFKFIFVLISLSHYAAVPIDRISLKCDEEGSLEANSENCSTFFTCINGMLSLTKCPSGLEFQKDWKICTWKEQADCTTVETSNEQDLDDHTNSASKTDGNTTLNSSIMSLLTDSRYDASKEAKKIEEPFILIFDKYFPQLKGWEQKIANTTVMNIVSDPQSQAVIEADVLVFRNSSCLYKRKIQIHSAAKLENSTVVAGMLEKYTVSCAVENLKYRLRTNYPEPPPWCFPHLVNKIASPNNLRRAYSLLNRLNSTYNLKK